MIQVNLLSETWTNSFLYNPLFYFAGQYCIEHRFRFAGRRMNALCTLLCKEHYRYLCLNVIFLVFSKISCDISYMSVAREAFSRTGEFPPSLYLQPALLFFLAKSHWLPRVVDSLQKNYFTFLTNHTNAGFFFLCCH